MAIYKDIFSYTAVYKAVSVSINSFPSNKGSIAVYKEVSGSMPRYMAVKAAYKDIYGKATEQSFEASQSNIKVSGSSARQSFRLDGL